MTKFIIKVSTAFAWLQSILLIPALIIYDMVITIKSGVSFKDWYKGLKTDVKDQHKLIKEIKRQMKCNKVQEDES